MRRRRREIGLAFVAALLAAALLARGALRARSADPRVPEADGTVPEPCGRVVVGAPAAAAESETGLASLPRASDATVAPRTWRVHGRVTDEAGAAVADAGVVLAVADRTRSDHAEVRVRTRTGPDGTFRLALAEEAGYPSPGEVFVAATARDARSLSLCPPLAGLRRDADGAFVAELVLYGVGALAGSVIGADEKPVPGAEVSVWAHWADGGTGWRRFPCAPDGSFTVLGLVGLISSRPHAPGHRNAGSHLGLIPVGGTLRQQLRLVSARGALRLRFTDPDAKPVAGLRVRGGGFHDAEDGIEAAGTTDADGQVTLEGLAPGNDVRLRLPPDGPAWSIDPAVLEGLEVSEASPPPVVTVPLQPASRVRGVVRATTGESIGAGFVVSLSFPHGMVQATTDARGRVAFDEPVPVGTARVEGSDLFDAYDVEVPPEAFDLDVVVEPCVRVEAHVLRPTGGPLCARWPHEPEAQGLVLRVEGTVDGREASHPLGLSRSDGVFSSWVPARVARASRVVFRLEGASPRELAATPAIGRVRTGETARVDLRVSPDVLATVRGHAFARGSATPIPSISLQLTPLEADRRRATRHAFCWNSDRFELPLVPAGRYELRISDGDRGAVRTLTVPETGVVDLEDVELVRP